jgi:hypothetical protein
MQISRAFPVFSVVAAIAYLASMALHPMFTLFTYAPRLGTWFGGVPSLGQREAPGMYWYSWLATGLMAGLVAGAASLALPVTDRPNRLGALVWIVPVLLILVLAYLERTWFGIP